MNSFVDCLDRREPNHKTLDDMSKSAKYIFKIYEEYYASVPIGWDTKQLALPELQKLIDRQQRLISMFNRGDIKDLSKIARKNDLNTVDEILKLQ